MRFSPNQLITLVLYKMIPLGKAIVSDDIADEYFACNLCKCKGQCCVVGDRGAPLEESELVILEENFEKIKPYLSENGIKALQKYGLYIKISDKKYFTPEMESGECAYVNYDNDGLAKCGIEKAYDEGATSFQKPISCHLYPIRITQFMDYEAINYHRWSICNSGCKLGKELGIPLYRFSKGCSYSEVRKNVVPRTR